MLKLGTMTHFDLHPSDPLNFDILKIKNGGGRHLEKSKNRYVSNSVTEGLEI